ncbi:MAG TPA: thiamine ABC transporter substrate-binding protein, partial [Anaerolineales bacterium]|nr:thiamine ABC transporter substrate-binding protein [Anaerolineales bacterium]
MAWINKKSISIISILGVVLLASCQATPAATPTAMATAVPTSTAPRQLSVMTHDSFAVSEEVVAAFESQHNARVQFIKGGDAGLALNKLILSKEQSLADVFYGLDNTYLSRALAEGIFEPYASPLLAEIPAEFQLDPAQGALPVDYGDVCVNYDKAYLVEKNLTPPQTLDDLLA